MEVSLGTEPPVFPLPKYVAVSAARVVAEKFALPVTYPVRVAVTVAVTDIAKAAPVILTDPLTICAAPEGEVTDH